MAIKMFILTIGVLLTGLSYSQGGWEGETEDVPAEMFDSQNGPVFNDGLVITVTLPESIGQVSVTEEKLVADVDSTDASISNAPTDDVVIEFDLVDDNSKFIHVEIARDGSGNSNVCFRRKYNVNALASQNLLVNGHVTLNANRCSISGNYTVYVTLEFTNKKMGKTNTKSFSL